jgi:hypothetical protein
LFWESWPWSAGATAGNVLSSRVAPEPVLSASLGERRAAANKPCPGLFYRYAYMPLQSGQRSSRAAFIPLRFRRLPAPGLPDQRRPVGFHHTIMVTMQCVIRLSGSSLALPTSLEVRPRAGPLVGTSGTPALLPERLNGYQAVHTRNRGMGWSQL